MLADSALQKKQHFAVERAERLKDPRMRVMGIERSALDEQVKEKKAIAALEKERNDYFDKQAMLMGKHAQVLQREVDDIRLQREREIRDFRVQFQKKDLSREYDLNNPKRVVDGIPARVRDDDPRCGAASMQKFEGEDLDAKHRKMAQAEQLRTWAQQQADEKLAKKWMEKEANRLYEDRAEEMAHRTWQIEQQVAHQRAQMAKTTAEFNKALAEQKRRERIVEKNNETQKNMEEMRNQLENQVLNEHPHEMSSGARYTKSDRFKGLTVSEKEAIMQTQQLQREQLAQKKRDEAEEERQFAMQDALNNRMATALERQRARERREGSKKLGQQHKAQAEEFADRKKAMDELYRNEVGEEYFVWGKCL